MPSTTPFGPALVAIGQQTFGPVALADTDTLVDLTIDRTIVGGLNLTALALVNLSFQQSNDNGATWDELCNANVVGGSILGHGGVPAVSNDVGTLLWPGTGRLGRAVVTVTGIAVELQGTLVIS